MHKLAALIVSPQRSVSCDIATLHRKIKPIAGLIINRLHRCRHQNQDLSMPSQPAFWKTGVLTKPAHRAQQRMIIGFAHLTTLSDEKRVRQNPSLNKTDLLSKRPPTKYANHQLTDQLAANEMAPQ
jgi:hypothetical protein